MEWQDLGRTRVSTTMNLTTELNKGELNVLTLK